MHFVYPTIKHLERLRAFDSVDAALAFARTQSGSHDRSERCRRRFRDPAGARGRMVTLVRAPNPSPMTLQGTNSYLLDCGNGDALAIDPGPAIEAHVERWSMRRRGASLTIRAIALTHGHPDHASAASALAARDRRAASTRIPTAGCAHDADLPLEGELRVGNVALRTIDAPGHTFDHVVFYLPQECALFTGDMILGEGTTRRRAARRRDAPVSAHPAAARRRVRRRASDLRRPRPRRHDPQAKIDEYIAHRLMREAQILDALRERAEDDSRFRPAHLLAAVRGALAGDGAADTRALDRARRAKARRLAAASTARCPPMRPRCSIPRSRRSSARRRLRWLLRSSEPSCG